LYTRKYDYDARFQSKRLCALAQVPVLLIVEQFCLHTSFTQCGGGFQFRKNSVYAVYYLMQTSLL